MPLLSSPVPRGTIRERITTLKFSKITFKDKPQTFKDIRFTRYQIPELFVSGQAQAFGTFNFPENFHNLNVSPKKT
jgi:hypothetical protein